MAQTHPDLDFLLQPLIRGAIRGAQEKSLEAV